MGFLLASIACAVAAGTIVAYAVILTFDWLKNKVKKIFNKNKNVKKVAALKLEKLVEECPNEISLEELLDEGNTHIMATVDYEGKIDEVEVIKDIGNGDYELDNMLGEDELVVITR